MLQVSKKIAIGRTRTSRCKFSSTLTDTSPLHQARQLGQPRRHVHQVFLIVARLLFESAESIVINNSPDRHSMDSSMHTDTYSSSPPGSHVAKIAVYLLFWIKAYCGMFSSQVSYQDQEGTSASKFVMEQTPDSLSIRSRRTEIAGKEIEREATGTCVGQSSKPCIDCYV